MIQPKPEQIRGLEGCGRAGIRPEDPDRQPWPLLRRQDPFVGTNQSSGQKRDIEDMGAVCSLPLTQEVEEQARNAVPPQRLGNVDIRRALMTRPTAMSEHNDTARV
ncbi:hypothetical protein BC360_16885 [Ensifer sp. LC163]|nr:hypothetical protein BC360_16885 [Ensifer sp. LC163]